MRERKKGQGQIVRAVGKILERGQFVGDEIGVREHDALGLAGSARGVDDGGELSRAQLVYAAAIDADFDLVRGRDERAS